MITEIPTGTDFCLAAGNMLNVAWEIAMESLDYCKRRGNGTLNVGWASSGWRDSLLVGDVWSRGGQ